MMIEMDEQYLDDRCKEIRGKIKIDKSLFLLPPEHDYLRMCRCVDIIGKGIKEAKA